VATATETRTSLAGAINGGSTSLDVTPLEAELLRSALEGDWVDLLISLWPSWGFCPRHALGFAALELERQDRLFSTAILYEHFLEGAGKVVNARFRTWRGIRYWLTSRTRCAICERVASGRTAGSESLAHQINERRRIHERIEESRAEWLHRACPLCVSNGIGLVCRPHVLTGRKQAELGSELLALYERLRRFVGSMTTARTETDVLDRFSLLETIGWFGGWEYLELLRDESKGAHEA
jgi:hypothetical protein